MSELLQPCFINTPVWCQNKGAEVSAQVDEDNVEQGISV